MHSLPTAARPLPATPRPASPVPPAVLAACAAVALWVALAAWMNQSQLQDSLEQFIWGRSLEWGYWKHPPLTSWLMWGALTLAGPTPLVTYALAAALTMVTIACTARLAQLLAGDDAAVATALLLALHYGFTRRAQMYNHNTVLLACIAATALLTVLAVRRNRLADWALAGLAAGVALLAKYQAALPLAGLLLAVVLTGNARRCRAGIAIAAGVATVPVLPHVLWAARHGWPTLHYALAYADGTPDEGAGRLLPVLAMQLKYFLPVAAFMLLLRLFAAPAAQARPDAAAGPDTHERAWLAGLLGLPVAALLVAAACGVRVQSHWGLQTTQFLVLPLALLVVRRFGPWRGAHWRAWAAVQAVSLGVFVGQGAGWLGAGHAAPGVRALPAASIAAAALDHWQRATGCELRYLSGPAAPAGMVAAYAGRPLLVLEDDDPAKSPWIDRDDMRKRGWLQLRRQDAPAHVERGDLLVALPGPGAPAGALTFHVHPPEVACDPPPQ